MSFVNHLAKEINCKIVYYGPGLGGKTANLQYIFSQASDETRGKMISLATDTERTLFFDFMPLELGKVRGYSVRFHLYTVPGQVFYDASRNLVLKGADGVIFVADSQPARADANIESVENLEQNLARTGVSLAQLPYVLQYNKRDLEEIMAVEEMDATLNPHRVPAFEASTITGLGILETLKALSKPVLQRISTQPA